MENELIECRIKIDEIDEKMIELFIERLKIAENVAIIKKNNNLPILNAEREAQIIEQSLKNINECDKEYVADFLKTMMKLSKDKQKNYIKTTL